MHDFAIPTSQVNNWPEPFPKLSSHMDLTSQDPGIIGLGCHIDAPDYDSSARANIEKPFFVLRTDQDTREIVYLHDPKGTEALAKCDFAADLLLTLTHQSFHVLLTYQFSHLYSYDEDSTDSFSPGGGIYDVMVITDGRTVTAWNAERDIPSIAHYLASEIEDGAVEDELDEPLEDFVCVLVPPVSSAHDFIEMTEIMQGPTHLLNELALKNDEDLRFCFMPEKVGT